MGAFKDVVSVCLIREETKRACKDCIYKGKTCNNINKKYGLNRPSEYLSKLYSHSQEYNGQVNGGN